MNKNTTLNILLIIGISVIGWLWYSDNSDFKEQITDIKKKQDSTSLIIQKDYKVRDSIILAERKSNDSLKNRVDKIQYIPYEKHTYIDRSIDDALDVLSEYQYNTRTGATD